MQDNLISNAYLGPTGAMFLAIAIAVLYIYPAQVGTFFQISVPRHIYFHVFILMKVPSPVSRQSLRITFTVSMELRAIKYV